MTRQYSRRSAPAACAAPARVPRATWIAVSLLGAAAVLAAPRAWAKDDAHAAPAPARAAKPAAEKAAPAAAHGAAEAHKAPAKAGEAKVASGDDPIEHLQQRLAERLGARKAADSASPYDIKVTGRTEPAKPAHTPRRAALPAPKVDVAALAAAHGGAAHWGYTGEAGPQAWASLKPEFAQCGLGKRQSPIDIRDGLKVDLEPIQFDYRPTGFNVIDNGHTVQVNLGVGNSLGIMGRRYDLVQFHFHRPSEERVNGRLYDMVAHLVHKDFNGRLAVVAVLLERGAAQPLIQTVWNNLPLEQGEEVSASVAIDMTQLLPEDRRYYTYMGSLTTPPCSEGVLWMVLKKPVQVSDAQIALFSRLYPMNARPVQPVAGRVVKESN